MEFIISISGDIIFTIKLLLSICNFDLVYYTTGNNNNIIFY